MAGRTRDIAPTFFTNEEFGCPLTQLLFAGLWCYADREGRLEDRPKRLKAWILPHYACDVDELLARLHNAGFVVRYEVDGERYIQVVKFEKWQKHIHDRETQSVIPACVATDKNEGEPKASLGGSKATPRSPCSSSSSSSSSRGSSNGKGDARGKTKTACKDSDAGPVEIPSQFSSQPAFMAAWDAWLEYRRAHRFSRRTQTLQAQLKMLAAEPSVLSAIECIETAIRCGWRGLFPSRSKKVAVAMQERCERIDAVFDAFRASAASTGHPERFGDVPANGQQRIDFEE